MANTISDAAITAALGRQMTQAVARQAVAAGNLANLDTPGYRAKDVKFADVLEGELSAGVIATTSPGHIGPAAGSAARPEAGEAAGLAARRDGNNVQLDREVARALAALRDDKIANGGTATAIEAWGLLAYQIGSDLAAARSANGAGEQVMQQLEQLRAQVSGVSMDEEAANLVRFQRAYEANARYFTTINDLLDTLMGMVQP